MTGKSTGTASNLLLPRMMTFLRDPRGSTMWIADQIGRAMQSWLTTVYCRGIAWGWGIELGSSCWFDGITEFKKYPTSTIQVGAYCRFRSAFRSNMVGINRRCGISTHTKTATISIGDQCGFSGTIIGAAKSITLGEHVLCGANVLITDFDWHSVGIDKTIDAFDEAQPVVIKDNVWIGLNSVVLKGSQIGENSIIGANSLVTSIIPANVVAGGAPARVIRQL